MSSTVVLPISVLHERVDAIFRKAGLNPIHEEALSWIPCGWLIEGPLFRER